MQVTENMVGLKTMMSLYPSKIVQFSISPFI